MSKLRGGKIGVRENSADGGGLVEFFIEEALKEAGVNPETEVEMVHDPVFGYRNNPVHIDMLRSGKVNAITSSPPFSDELEKEGYPVILDPNVVFPRRPGKVTVAPRRTIEQRGDELKAYFRAITRTFWFMRDVNNFQYLHDLEARLRKLTHNEDEQRLFIASAPDRVDSWALPMDGGIERHALERIIQEMVKRGRLDSRFRSAMYSKTTPCAMPTAKSALGQSSNPRSTRLWQPWRNMGFRNRASPAREDSTLAIAAL